MHVDPVVRRASVYVPVKHSEGGNTFVVETSGTERPGECPPVAKTGHHKRILQPRGKPERLYQEYDVDFVSLSEKLSDQQYSQRTAIDPPDDVRVVDFRPRSER